ncbi:BTAD domain-containing putative transcriptional regulator [Streptomyces sp. NPDC051364]|uniref:AfsR/SARP family transcriptional regulator n=1 Tax=Streptomyces sp. NPDC051364 TaxID=3155799 RepID=UPI00344ACE0E
MRIAILGPLEVRTGDGNRGGHRDGSGDESRDGSGSGSGSGDVVGVGGARLRTLLVLLALEPGRVVSSELLIDGIWDRDPPMGAPNALQALVSRLRRALPGVKIGSHPAGYRLLVEPEAVDAVRFERLAAAGRAALAREPATAARTLREALELWRGPALLDVAGSDFFRAPVTRLTELRAAVLEDRIEADLRLGLGRELTGELASLVAEHPLRERLVGALMRALVAAGRPAEALAAYVRAREALAEELGADPSPELAALHTAVLRGEVGAEPLQPVQPVQPVGAVAPVQNQAEPQPASAAAAPADAPPATNLRAPLASFVGRDADLARVAALIGEHRLTTLTGPGGAGKTRLSVEAARPLLGRFPDGVWQVELAPLGAEADVPQAVLSALGLREQASAPGEPLDRLVAALRTRTALLVLDNCEHLIEAAATLADRLLGACPGVRILATSREPLGLTGEALWPVEPLALPPQDAGAAEALSYAAVRLLGDRAAAARSGFTVGDDTAAAVTRIVRALDGMPLAIELAAARLRTMSAEQLAVGLDDRFRLLTGGARTAPRQHRTLRAVVDWSWELLTGPEQALLRRLAAFPGGVTLEAAERVCADTPTGGAAGVEAAVGVRNLAEAVDVVDVVDVRDVLDLMTSLTEKSLLVTAGDGRYRMLQTIRAYGLERLAEAGEQEPVRRAQSAYFTGLARTADPHLRRAGQLEWLARLAVEHDNLKAALRGTIAAGDARAAVGLVSTAGWYWWLSGHKAEGAELVAAALALPGPAAEEEDLVVAYALSVLFATAGVGDERKLAALLGEALRLAERTDSRHPVVRFLGPVDRMLRSAAAGRPAPADTWDELLADADPWVRAQGRLEGARTLLGAGGSPALAEQAIEEALAGFRALGERWGASFALTVLADLVARRGDFAAALGHYDQAVRVVGEIGVLEDRLHALIRQAQLSWLAGDPAGSAAALARAEQDAAAAGWPESIAVLAHGKAELACWTGKFPEARAELARAEAAIAGISVHPVFRAMALDTRGHLDAAEGELDEARAWRAQALDLALGSGHAPTVAQVLVGVADQAVREDRPEQAARLLAAALAVRGGPDHGRPDAARVENAARAALGEGFTEAARCGAESGATSSVEAVRELAAPTLSRPGG